MNKFIKGISVIALVLAPTAVVQAAGVTYAGEDITTQGNYDDINITKPFATNSDNVYGDDGTVFFGAQNPGTTYTDGGYGYQGGVDPFNFVNAGNDGDFTTLYNPPYYISSMSDLQLDSMYGGWGYTQIDVPGGGPSTDPETTQSGFTAIHANFNNHGALTFTFALPQADVQIGVLFTEGEPNFTLTQTGGNIPAGGFSATTTNLTYSGLDYAFFDLTNVQAGDTFSLYVYGNQATGDANQGLVGLTFDTVDTMPAPEPSVWALSVAGFAGLFFFHRLRKYAV